VAMIEGFAREMPEDAMVAAIMFAHKQIVAIIDLIEELRTKAGLPVKKLPPPPPENPLKQVLYEKYGNELKSRKLTKAKLERYAKVDELKDQLKKEFLAEGTTYTDGQFGQAWMALEERVFRDLALAGTRLDGREFKEIRPLMCEVSLFPCTHGTALFQR